MIYAIKNGLELAVKTQMINNSLIRLFPFQELN